MKREFLQNLQVGDTPLSKEVIDAIMAENGRDIESAKSAFRDYDALKAALNEAQCTIESLQGGENWEEKYKLAEEKYAAQIDNLKFSHLLDTAIAKAKGRSTKAICALLDMETLRSSENRAAAIEKAVEDLKTDSPYLFDCGYAHPLYPKGTGAGSTLPEREPATLAGALKERFLQERMY